jgi:hypothetical protein
MTWSALSAESLVVCLLSPSASQPGSCMPRGPDGSLGFKPQVTYHTLMVLRAALYYPPPGSKRHHEIDNTTPARALSRVDSE